MIVDDDTDSDTYIPSENCDSDDSEHTDEYDPSLQDPCVQADDKICREPFINHSTANQSVPLQNREPVVSRTDDQMSTEMLTDHSTAYQSVPLQNIEPVASCSGEHATDSLANRKIAKKGMADKSKWKRNIKLMDRMSGKGRSMKPVTCKCCASKFTEADRKSIFESFWKISWLRKRDFLISHVQKTPAKRHTVEKSRRGHSYKYNLPKEEIGNIVVCKTFFLRTLAIGAKMIQGTLTRSIINGLITAKKDGRKGRSPANKTSELLINDVKIFLNKLPRVPSHYCRKESNRLYLEPGWTNKKLYNAYKLDSQEDKKVSQKIFERIVEDMNLSFFKPRKDQCDLCLGHKNGLIDDDIWQEHSQLKDCAREAKEMDKNSCLNNPKLVVVTMDLQAVLLCPKSMSSATYYKRKLSVHNFTLYNLATKDTVCYTWHEGQGGLEADEFATIVINYLESLSSDVKEVIFWSDGCTYQNRNSTLSSAIYQFVTSTKNTNIRVIHQKYLVRGHTQMECDSVHSAIESRARNIEIYTPIEWETVFKTARAKQPYKVISLSYTFWKSYFPSISSIRPGKRAGDPVVTDIRHISYTREGDILYSLSHFTPLSPLGCRIKVRGYYEPIQKYDSVISLAHKLPDLLELKRLIVPAEHQQFYDQLV